MQARETRLAQTSHCRAAGQVVAAVVASGFFLTGCGRGAVGPSEDATQSAAAAESGYASPPLALAARRTAVGLAIQGRSDPNARVRLSSPDGEAFGATADAQGAWSIMLPASDTVRLFGLSEVLGARVVQGGGYLAVLPGLGRPAVLLRAGGGTEVFGSAQGPPQITVVDYDAGGGAVICGVARPDEAIRLTMDGASAGEARSDDGGRFSIPLAGLIKAGDHRAAVQSGSGQQSEVDFSVGGAAPITGLPYRGARPGGYWRIDWLTPGGGRQTTLVIDPADGRRTP